jgi:hypothetical protein
MTLRIGSLSKVLTVAALVGAVVASLSASAAPARSTAPAALARATACPNHWGHLAKHGGTMVRARVSNVRAGKHACFDRLVVDVGGHNQAGYRVRYVHRIISDGSGQVVHVQGGARLLVSVMAPAASGFAVNSHHVVNVDGFRTFRQVVGAGSFEGITTLGLGVRARLGFRVFTVRVDKHHTSLVIDVAH